MVKKHVVHTTSPPTHLKHLTMLNIQRFKVNFIEENCYVVSDETREAVVIDCGAFFPEEHTAISKYLTDNKLKPCHLLCTHGHFDHVFGAQFIADTYHLTPEMCVDEVATYEQAAEQMQAFLHRDFPLSLPSVGKTFKEGDIIRFGSHQLRVIETPGHTPGGVCFYCEAEKVLFSGDSLFRHEIGRCDPPGGNEAQLIQGLKEKILTLPSDVKVLPGHDVATTIGDEKTGNRYLR